MWTIMLEILMTNTVQCEKVKQVALEERFVEGLYVVYNQTPFFRNL